MKYRVAVLALVLVAVGVFFGFKLGSKNLGSNTPTATTSQNPSSNAAVLDLSGKGLT